MSAKHASRLQKRSPKDITICGIFFYPVGLTDEYPDSRNPDKRLRRARPRFCCTLVPVLDCANGYQKKNQEGLKVDGSCRSEGDAEEAGDEGSEC
jgi:hypothetical protein